MSVLIFDADKSLASIGGYENCEKQFGIKPISVNNGLKDISDILNNIFVRKEVQETHPLFKEKYTRTVYELKEEAKKLNLEAIVIDTLSHCFRQDMRLLEQANHSGAMEMKDWGTLERKYNAFISRISLLPLPIIINSHISTSKNADGTLYFSPALKGSTADFIYEYFDCIFYTKPTKDKKKFEWQTFASNVKFGKDRLGLLEDFIPQNYKEVLTKYREQNNPNPKVLVIGESGTNKTRALLTLIN